MKKFFRVPERKKRLCSGEVSYIILFLIAAFSILLVGGGSTISNQYNSFGELILSAIKPRNTDTIQLHTLQFVTYTPTPTFPSGITISPEVSPSGNPTLTQTPTSVPSVTSPVGTSLLCGTNLGLFSDGDYVTNTPAQQSLATLHVRTLRIPWRTGPNDDPTGSRLVKSVQITHTLGVIPLIILPLDTAFIPQDIQMVQKINTIMGGAQVFYELGNESFDAAYTGKWNQIITQVKKVAVNAWFGGPVALLNAGPGATSSMAQFYVSAKPAPDFLDWHEYTCGHADSAQYCFDHIATAPGHNWGVHIQDTLAALQKLGVPSMPKVFITEWNYDSAALGSSTPDPRLATLNSMHFVQAALTELKTIGVYAAYHYVLNTNSDYNLINNNGGLTGEGVDFQSWCTHG